MSELEFGQAPLHKLSPRRKSTQINAALLALIVVTVLIPVYGHYSTRDVRNALLDGAGQPAPATVSEQSSDAALEALAQARTRWLSLGIAAAVLITASEDLIEEMTEALDDMKDRLDGEHRDLFTELSRHLADNMQRIRANGERVDRIVNDMIRIGRGGGRTRHVDITELLTKQTQLAYRSHRAQDRRFTMDIGTEFDPDVGTVPMVPEDMARVFTNIVGNACFATAEKAGQRKAAGDDAYMPRLRLSAKRLDDVVEIRIRDNGTGIAADTMDKIFNPFFTTKDTDKGTGLGLSISHDIIRQHGGDITPDSVPGEYTEIVITIPSTSKALAASAQAKLVRSSPAARSEPRRVPPV